MMFFLSFAFPVLIGISLLAGYYQGRPVSSERVFFALSLSTGLGLGLSSLAYFLWLSVLKQSQNRYVYFEAIFLAFSLVYAWQHLRRKSRDGHVDSPSIQAAAPRASRVITLSFWLLCATSFLSVLFISLRNLHGRWDAWAIWNLRARFLFRGGSNWADAFTDLLSWSHPDYPLLLPGLTAKGWSFTGNETVWVPISLSLVFTFATIFLLVSSVSILRGRNRAYLAGIALIASFQFIRYGASQCADIPLGFFILAGTALFVVYDFQRTKDKNLVVLSGAMVGLSLWAKNEGILFLFAVLIGRGLASLGKNVIKTYIRELVSFLKGLLPVLSVWVFFKLKYATGSDFFAPENVSQFFSRLTDWPRHTLVAKLYLDKLIRFENGLLILACFLLLLLGVNKPVENKWKAFAPLFTLLVMCGGYYAVFVLTPYDVNWHINTALNRLLLHLWPAALFLIFFFAKWDLSSKKRE